MSILQLPKLVLTRIDIDRLTQYRALKKQELMIKLKVLLSCVWDAKGEDNLDASSGGVWCINVGYVWPKK